MAKYLDLTGLQTFWTKIKTYISNSVTTNSPSASKTVTGFNEGKITYGDIKISESQVTNLTTHLNDKAPLASPTLTGTPTAPTAADGTNTTQIATTAFVNTAITSKMSQADAMIYKGTLDGAATSSTNKYGALTPAADKGATYKVKTAGYIDGVKVEVGDMLICNTDSTAKATASNYETIKDKWDFIQGNLDGVVVGPSESVSGNVVLFDGTTGKLVKDSGFTIGKSVPSDAKFTDTTYSSKTAASGGTDVSLVTTGEKYTWNNKASTAVATTSKDGLMSKDDKTKLNGTVAGPSSSVSGNVALFDGTTGKVIKDSGFTIGKSVPADAKFTDTTYSSKTAASGGTDVSLVTTGEKYTWNNKASTDVATTSKDGLMSSTDKSKLDGIAANANNYTHPTSSGNKHIPSGGSSGQVLKYKADGEAQWANDTDTNDTRSGLAICATAAATAAKLATMPSFVLSNNASILLKVNTANTAQQALTLNVNSTGAKAIVVGGTPTSETSYTLAAGYYWATYDGTNWNLTTVNFTDTKTTAGSSNKASTKLFLVGTESQSSSRTSYSNVNVYIGTDNCLYSNAKKVCTEEYASSTYEPKMTAITDDEIAALT